MIIIKQLILESIEELQKQEIDNFLAEFKNFNPKLEKKRLKSLVEKFNELRRDVNNELYEKTNKSVYTRRFYKVEENIKTLASKIQRFESCKDRIDTLARIHKKYVFEKYGKIV